MAVDSGQMWADGPPKGAPHGSMRIAICVPELRPLQDAMSGKPADATYVIQANLAARLRANGHSLTFVVARDLEETVATADLEHPRLAPRTWSASRWFDLTGKGVWQVQRRLGVPYLNVFSSYRFFDACLQCLPGHDLVYERNGLFNVGAAMACRRLKLPYVIFFEADQIMELDIMGTPITGLLRWRAEEMLRYNLKAADCIICVSEQGKTHLATNWRVPAEKIVVFPNAVDVQRFQPDPEARAEVRAALGMGTNPMVVFVGNFFHWHDVATLLHAFAQVQVAFPDSRLVLVGDGTQRQAMMQKAAELGLNQAARFVGIVPHAEVPRYLAAADVAVVPYPAMTQELWLSPLKLFEYMASGQAVVASAIGQLLDVVQDGCNGLLVAPGDASAMAIALHRLIGDPALRERLGRQARQDAVNRYSWERYMARLERLFAAVVARQPVTAI